MIRPSIRLFGCVVLMAPLMGCAPANQAVANMDHFFDSLETPRAPQEATAPAQARETRGPVLTQRAGERYLVTGPGYAPAYPPYQVPAPQQHAPAPHAGNPTGTNQASVSD